MKPLLVVPKFTTSKIFTISRCLMMAETRPRNSYSGSLPAGTLPTLPGRTGPAASASLPPKQPESSASSCNERFLPALWPGPNAASPSGGGIAATTAGPLANTNDMLQALKQKAIDRSQQFKQNRSKSVPKSAGSNREDSAGHKRPGRPQLPIRKAERLDPEEVNRNLAVKLQPLEQMTNAILTAAEERKGGGGTPLIKATCKDFVVGRASCAASSVVTLYPDRLEYKFSHSSQGRIDMAMYLKDMQAPELNRKTGVLKFRVGKPLRHFIDSYDCTDSAHILALTFHDKGEAAQFQQLLSSTCKVALQVLGGEQ